MKKLLALLALTLLPLAAFGQVSFTNNTGGMTLTFYVTNMPPDLRAELESVWRQHAMLCTTNTASRFYTPTYRYTTNYVQSGTDTNGEPVFSQVITTNVAWGRQEMLGIISQPSARVTANVTEIAREWIAARRAIMAKARLDE